MILERKAMCMEIVSYENKKKEEVDENLIKKYMESMRVSENPCRYCTSDTGRCSNCHSVCEKGIAHERLMRAEKAKIDKEKRKTKEWEGMYGNYSYKLARYIHNHRSSLKGKTCIVR